MAGSAVDDPTDWMRQVATNSDEDGVTGFDLTMWEANTWVLHAMYEQDEVPLEMTAHELRRQAIVSGEVDPIIVNGVNLDEAAVLSGMPLGRCDAPGPGWHRLRWIDLARRISAPLGASGVPPCFRWFPYQSWPADIRPPTEGSMDRETFLRLVQLLTAQPGTNGQTLVMCFFAPLATREDTFDRPLVVTRPLDALAELYDWEPVHGSPSNIWPLDRSWFVYTDWDLSGTRVSGSSDLVASLVSDGQLETISYS